MKTVIANLLIAAHLLSAVDCAASELMPIPSILGYVLGQPIDTFHGASVRCNTAREQNSGPIRRREVIQREIYRLQLSEDSWCKLDRPPPVAGQAVKFASLNIDKGCVSRIDVEFEKQSNRQETSDAIVKMISLQYGKGTERTFRTGRGMRWDRLTRDYNWFGEKATIHFSEADGRLVMSTEARCVLNLKLQRKIMRLEQQAGKLGETKK